MGFNIHELVDDTLSYAYTIRDWAEAFDESRERLSVAFSESQVRAFELFLRGSSYFASRNKTQAYHLVAGLEPSALWDWDVSPPGR